MTREQIQKGNEMLETISAMEDVLNSISYKDQPLLENDSDTVHKLLSRFFLNQIKNKRISEEVREALARIAFITITDEMKRDLKNLNKLLEGL